MSVQFGRWNTDGKPIDREHLANIKPMIAAYGPDDGGCYSQTNISIHYRAFHTTQESRRESQPHVTPSGTVISWDGRLDNRADLIRQLRDHSAPRSSDVSIVAAAYEQWGAASFAQLIGDWALSIWDARSASLILAKDPIGTRHLYYSVEKDHITWSTILDPIVLFAGRRFALNEEYIAGWFSLFPAAHLTAYVGIHSVPPSCSVLLREQEHSIRKYWELDPGKRIRYRTDAEYEEHFRTVFGEAVRRRLRSDSPILAELSGGMDSSSIVCMADTMIASGSAECPRLDTLSYYNDFEPNWNERPYFTKVEQQRGRTGWHIDVSKQELFNFELASDRFMATPGSGDGRPSQASTELASCLSSQGNRVVLSGIGGDEFTGGVPAATSELADLLVTIEFRALAHQLKVWALNKRKPWFHLFWETARQFLPPTLVGVPEDRLPAAWLHQSFVHRHRAALQGYHNRLKVLGPLPSLQKNIFTLEAMRRQLGSYASPSDTLYEKRYPYLDRSFLEFIVAIPRQQLVRPGQRRSLMRRSLAGIVPDELLNRKRKAFVSRTPMAAVVTEWTRIIALTQNMTSGSLGIVEPNEYVAALQKARQGHEAPMVILMRTLGIELWLRRLSNFNVLVGMPETTREAGKWRPCTAISAEKN